MVVVFPNVSDASHLAAVEEEATDDDDDDGGDDGEDV